MKALKEGDDAGTPSSEDNTGTDNNSTCNVTVIVSNSSLNVVWARHMKSLNVTDSVIKRLHGGRLDGFMLSKSTVEEMDDVEVVGRGAKWSTIGFPGTISVTLKAPLEASGISLLRVCIRIQSNRLGDGR